MPFSKLNKMELSRPLLWSIATAVILILLLIRFFPVVDDFSLENPFWNGLSKFHKIASPKSMVSLSEIKSSISFPSQTALYLIGPTTSFSQEEALLIKEYLREGGTLILADDFGTANNLLKELELNTHFSKYLLVDPLFKDKTSSFPKIIDLNLPQAPTKISALTFNYATTLNIDPLEVEIIASSSSFSFIDSNLNKSWDEGEAKGPFPVIGKIKYGEGMLYLISDSSILINSMLNKEGNKEPISLFTENKESFIDTSHWLEGRLSKLKSAEVSLYQFFSSSMEARYSLLFLLIAAIVWFKVKQKKGRVTEDLEEVLAEHPHWDKETLKMLKKEREK